MFELLLYVFVIIPFCFLVGYYVLGALLFIFIDVRKFFTEGIKEALVEVKNVLIGVFTKNKNKN